MSQEYPTKSDSKAPAATEIEKLLKLFKHIITPEKNKDYLDLLAVCSVSGKYQDFTQATAVGLISPWQLPEKNKAFIALAKKGITLEPILLAAINADHDRLEAEILKGHLLETDNQGNTAIHYASANNQLSIIKSLLKEQPTLVKVRDLKGMTPLLWAARNGCLAALSWLLTEGGASISQQNNEQQTALLVAAHNNQLETVQYLLQKEGGATITERDQSGASALLIAASCGHIDLMDLLLKHGFSIAEKDPLRGATPLLWAARKGQLTAVKWLLAHGASVTETDNFGKTALLCAAQYGQLETVKWLLSAAGQASAAEQDTSGINALLIAAYYGRLETVQWLLTEGGFSIDFSCKDGATALLLAALEGRLATVQYLLTQGAQINEKNNRGMTAILLAAQRGKLETLQWLSSTGGGKLSDCDKEGMTALLWAAGQGDIDTVRWLLSKEGGAKITEKTTKGITVLTQAAASGNAKLLSLLISKYGADPGDCRPITASAQGDCVELCSDGGKQLKALFADYYLQQEHRLYSAAMELGLPSTFPDPLRDLIAQYALSTEEEVIALPEKMTTQNKQLLKPLADHAHSYNPRTRWKKLSATLLQEISELTPCNPLTIRAAVKAALDDPKNVKIIGSNLEIVLKNILKKTDHLETVAPLTSSLLASLDKPEQQELQPLPRPTGKKKDTTFVGRIKSIMPLTAFSVCATTSKKNKPDSPDKDSQSQRTLSCCSSFFSPSAATSPPVSQEIQSERTQAEEISRAAILLL